MKNSQMLVAHDACGCNQTLLDEGILNSLGNALSTPDKLYHAYIEPKAEPIKRRQENGSAKLMEQWRMISDKIASKQQSDAMADQAKEMNKIMLVARRIMHGDKVPAKDEKKLMEYDPKLYMMAKNAAAMLEMRKRKEHKSLWEDEEEKEQVSATEEANNTEAFADVVRLCRYVAEDTELTPAMTEEQLPCADVNGDSIVDSSDITLIARYLAHLVDAL